MRRFVKFKRLAAPEASPETPNYAAMAKPILAALARKRGVKGVPERMRRETLIKKLEEV